MWLGGKESTRQCRRHKRREFDPWVGKIPGLGRSLGEGKDYPLQYSGLENSMDCIVHGVRKSQTGLNDFHFHFHLDGTIVNSILNGYMLNTFLAQFLNEISTPANMLCNIVLKFLGQTGPSLELSSRLEAGGCAVRASPGRLGSLAQPQRRGTSP